MATQYQVQEKAGIYSLLLNNFTLEVSNAHISRGNNGGSVRCVFAVYQGTSTSFKDRANLTSSRARKGLINDLASKNIQIPEDALLAFELAIRSVLNNSSNTTSNSQTSQATQLIKLAVKEGVELFHTPDLVPYAVMLVNNHSETWGLRTRAFRQWLRRLYYQQNQTAPSTSAAVEALEVLEGMALFDGPIYPVHIRTAEHNGNIYLDLCDTNWQAVEIDSNGWQIIAKAPVYFRRAPGMLALPVPIHGGKLDDLRKFINVRDEDWPLVKGWLTATLRACGPYPILSLNGEQGSAKSTTSRVLRMLVDPNDVPIRSAPRDEHDLIIAANNSNMINLDNLSHLADFLSDALCRISTGGGFSTRALFTDDEERLFTALRPIIINGISEVVNRSDLLDRALLLSMLQISEDKRKEEADFWPEFETACPMILGGLLDRVSRAIRNMPTTQLDRLPRMADFARWAVAGEDEEERGTFIQRYFENRADANALALEGSPVVEALQELLASYDLIVGKGEEFWRGTARDLFNTLLRLFRKTRGQQEDPEVEEGEEETSKQPEEGNKKQEKKHRLPRGWPKNEQALSTTLRRLAPNLRATGIEVGFDRDGKGKDRKRIIILSRSDALEPGSDALKGGSDARSDALENSKTASTDPNVSTNLFDWVASDASDALSHTSKCISVLNDKERTAANSDNGWKKQEVCKDASAPSDTSLGVPLRFNVGSWVWAVNGQDRTCDHPLLISGGEVLNGSGLYQIIGLDVGHWENWLNPCDRKSADEALLAFGQELQWRSVAIFPPVSIAEGEIAWRQFTKNASDERLARALLSAAIETESVLLREGG